MEVSRFRHTFFHAHGDSLLDQSPTWVAQIWHAIWRLLIQRYALEDATSFEISCLSALIVKIDFATYILALKHDPLLFSTAVTRCLKKADTMPNNKKKKGGAKAKGGAGRSNAANRDNLTGLDEMLR